MSEESRPQETPATLPAVDALPRPRVRRELVDACVEGECVLYAGNGLSAQSGLPTWSELMRKVVEWAISRGIVDERVGHSLTAGLQQRDIEAVSEGLLHNLGDKLSGLQEFLQETLVNRVAPSPVHSILGGVGFNAVLTTNLDELLDESFLGNSLPVYTPADADALLTALSNRNFFILKLRGRLSAAETIILSAAQYDEKVGTNRAFSTFMEALFFSRTIFFVGARLESIEAYLKVIKSSQTRPRKHFALVDVSDNLPAWELKSDSLSRRYNIEVIPYVSTPKHPEVEEFIRKLASRVNAKKQAKNKRPITQTAESSKGALKRLTLVDIGPFDNLELNFDPGWNILLGDNGVGKSTILKAIAVAICGRDAQAYANRLIRVGKPSGTILLETDRGIRYKTEIIRGSVEAELISTPGRPLEAEGWLAIGFPSSRIFSWNRSTTFGAPVHKRPSPEDLLPLIQGVSDPRIDKVKDWLVNLDAWSNAARVANEDWRQYELLRENFFSVVGKLASGTKVEYGGIESSTFEVRVNTSDGTIPLESISQGTAAVLGWVGILLQRLHEIPPDPGISPMDRYAIVLIDELDAHMHPAWQQALIPLLKESFKNIQFLATTHSPFLAIGRRAREIVRLSRDPATGKARGEPIEYDTTEMGVANVLTSYLFGLESPMDYDLQRDLRRKRILAVKPILTDKERADLKELTDRLEDVDTVAMVRDPLYKLFVEEMTRRQKMIDEGTVKVTKEKEEEQRQLTREILDELTRKNHPPHEVHTAQRD